IERKTGSRSSVFSLLTRYTGKSEVLPIAKYRPYDITIEPRFQLRQVVKYNIYFRSRTMISDMRFSGRIGRIGGTAQIQNNGLIGWIYDHPILEIFFASSRQR